MLRRLIRSKELRAVLIAAASFSILVVLLFSQTTPAQSASAWLPAAHAPEPQAGDPGRGQALFLGKAPLENDGPPCMACHNVGGSGLLGGGAVGPDLTEMSTFYRAADLTAEKFAAKPFAPLPVMGVPGWCSANENPDFYTDSQVFRRPSTYCA